ncbi:synaptotagmin-1-like [Hyla sarda]|uniref:synaptotagmin-1-like n=1 Tax=Hyla sarda TaxID=327740 RepID=UPI0024C4203A|nr:synaptotagmin-1-like [Hyla sarda]XP_056383061.1 synaptotagmin-1-like [Hyla sarda]XP_056383062.1 synaptotagmin-1-like [Hyla sarda]XP_056383063.1 synaptotagmin-1-like [Hyla sarda]XP_056383064.1 synaptotagmin-1-like [Hyla sarda]XP_056383065.1 synaptotagmin-1-like [Hyla sarda]XP_056383066.1 synaptotagmin-1-like [Hyla sarda]
MCSALENTSFRYLSFQIYLPISDTLKYCLLALAIALFLAALILLACKMHQYYAYKATSIVKDKKFISGSNAEKKSEGNILVKSLSPDFFEVARKEQDSKIQLMQKEMEKLEVHLTPSPPSTESLDDVGSDSDRPQGPRGKLKYNVHYNKKTTTLILSVIEATDLPEYSRDPFVRIRVFSKADESQSDVQSVIHECETRVVKNSRNPIFDEDFSFSVKDYPLWNLLLKLEVKDFDKYSRHTLIGEIRTALKDLKVSETLEFNEDLQEKTKDIIGEVLISLKCLPTAQKIEVGILKFKTSSSSIIKERDVYARIDVFSNQHKQKHQKSSLRAKSKVTVFNETFLFSLPDPGKTQCFILISLYETLATGKKLIGQATLGNQKNKFKDNHWDLMMQTLRQPVADWHPLYI